MCWTAPAYPDNHQRVTRTFVALLLTASLAGCGGCGGESEMKKQSQRLWGKDKLAQEVDAKAKEPIDAHALADRPDLRSRVLTMPFEEVVARLGFIEYAGSARFLLKRNGHTIDVPESTLVRHGLHGSFLVRQTDSDGAVTREIIYNNEVLYGRNGDKGKMRVLGASAGTHRKLREEAWQPLSVFTSYYGPRVGLRKAGGASVKGRSAVEYEILLLDGSPTIKVPGMKGVKKPISLTGKLYVDDTTGVPIKTELKGRLEIPDEKPSEGSTPGVLDLSLSYEIKTVPGEEIKPKEWIPTIKRREVDLDPLAFLEGETRTSTVIGGKKKKDPPARPPEPKEAKEDAAEKKKEAATTPEPKKSKKKKANKKRR